MKLDCIEYKGEWAVINIDMFTWGNGNQGVISIGSDPEHAWCMATHKLSERIEAVKRAADANF